MSVQVVVDHSLTLVSLDTVASRSPDGLNTQALTWSECAISGEGGTSLPVVRSHMRTVLSPLQETSFWSTGDQLTKFTSTVCPLNSRKQDTSMNWGEKEFPNYVSVFITAS